MIHSWTIGEATVTGVAEYFGPVHVPDALYPDMDRQVLRDHRAQMEGAFWIEAIDRLVIGVHPWVLRLGDRVILVDAGIGNLKPRRTPRANMLNTVVPDWLAAAGATPDSVTDVLTTHLHNDHTGWNTRLDGGAWVPTFPKATYHMPQVDYDWFGEQHRAGRAKDNAFADSVMPVVDAGLAHFVAPGDRVAGLEVTATPGHTPGHVNYWLESAGRTAVFSGDVMHHPVQIYRPEWNTVVDVQPDLARPTRAAFLAEAAERDALFMPCHFGPPHCGFVRRDGAGYRYEPAPAGARVPANAASAWGAGRPARAPKLTMTEG
jgi:glyoxylase-like metal-dependent hydrolase (beta-lactamase superfamily II)